MFISVSVADPGFPRRDGSWVIYLLFWSFLPKTVWNWKLLAVSKKNYESVSVYASASDFGWSQNVFLDHSRKCKYLQKWNVRMVLKILWRRSSVDGLQRFFDTIQFAFVNIYISWNGLRKPFKCSNLYWNWCRFEAFQNPQLDGGVSLAPPPNSVTWQLNWLLASKHWRRDKTGRCDRSASGCVPPHFLKITLNLLSLKKLKNKKN